MLSEAHQIRRLWLWQRAWLALLILVLLVGVAAWEIGRINTVMQTPSVHYADGGLKLSITYAGCPIVVTGLINNTDWAVLPEPIIVTDSDGAFLDKATLTGLTWRDRHGESATPPPLGSPIKLLYYKPSLTGPSKAW